MTAKQPTLHGYPVEVGDRVWSLEYGWGEVIKIYPEEKYPVLVRFEAQSLRIFFDPSEVQTLFWQPVEITPPPKPEPEIDWTKVPQGAPVEVRNSIVDNWQPAVFIAYAPKTITKDNFNWVAKCDTLATTVRSYPQCRLARGVEVKKECLK